MADRPQRSRPFDVRAFELVQRPDLGWRDLVPHIASGALVWDVPKTLAAPEPDADPDRVAMLCASSEAALRAPGTGDELRGRLTPFAAACRAWLAERGHLDLLPPAPPGNTTP